MKRFICAAISAVMITASTAASAREWVHVSDWAYNGVSIFTSGGFLTPAFDSISDYTEDITRGQFAELLCSVLIKTGSLYQIDDSMPYNSHMLEKYADLDDNIYYKTLICRGIIKGDYDGSDNQKEAHIFPESLITREDASVLISRGAAQAFGQTITGDTLSYTDSADISDYAAESVAALSRLGIISGMEDNTFRPKENITIEQAITLLYRLYRVIPSSPSADGYTVTADAETAIKDYENGYIETKLKNTLYVKGGGKSLAFDTDIYSNIFCASRGDTKVYVTAQTYQNRSDVFDMGTGKLEFTVPYPIYDTDENYIYTKSAPYGMCSFGLYGYDNKEILKPEYSLEEIRKLIADNFRVPEYKKRESDGWIYYTDSDDGNRLYMADSNGENKSLVSSESVCNIEVIGDWVYYFKADNPNVALYRVKTDGSVTQTIAEGMTRINIVGDTEAYLDNSPTGGGYVFVLCFSENGDSALLSVPENGDSKTIFSGDFHNANLMRADKGEKSQLYFSSSENGITRIYRTDGGAPVPVGKTGIELGGLLLTDDNRFVVMAYDYNVSTAEPHIYIADTELNYIGEYDANREYSPIDIGIDWDENERGVYRNLSDDKYTIFKRYSSTFELFAADKNGDEIQITHGFEPRTFARAGNKILYTAQDADTGIPHLREYDLDTKTDKIAVSDFRYGRLDSLSIGTYCGRNLNVMRYDPESGTTEQIYPNSGKNRYGEARALIAMDGSIVKIDTDGNYCDIITGGIGEAVYVKNGCANGWRLQSSVSMAPQPPDNTGYDRLYIRYYSLN